MGKYVGKISRLSNERIYNALRIEGFYERYPNITKKDVIKVISVLKHKLSYNNITGVTELDGEWIGSYSNISDIQKYDNYEDLIAWEFGGHILNSVQRVHNGYSMI